MVSRHAPLRILNLRVKPRGLFTIGRFGGVFHLKRQNRSERGFPWIWGSVPPGRQFTKRTPGHSEHGSGGAKAQKTKNTLYIGLILAF